MQGPVVSEVWQVFSPWVTQKVRLIEPLVTALHTQSLPRFSTDVQVRLWANATSAEFEWTAGPVPCDDGLGRELFVTYATPLETNATWWTDSEGAV